MNSHSVDSLFDNMHTKCISSVQKLYASIQSWYDNVQMDMFCIYIYNPLYACYFQFFPPKITYMPQNTTQSAADNREWRTRNRCEECLFFGRKEGEKSIRSRFSEKVFTSLSYYIFWQQSYILGVKINIFAIHGSPVKYLAVLCTDCGYISVNINVWYIVRDAKK